MSKVTSLWGRSLKVLSKCIRLCHCLCLCHCLFFGQVMSLHHSDQMSQRPKVSRIALSGCSLNVKNVFSYDTLLIKEGWNIKSIHQKPSTPPSISLLRGASEGALAILYLYSSSFTCSHIYLLFGHIWQTLSWDEKLKQFWESKKLILAGDIHLKISSLTPGYLWGVTYLGWIT